jgi:hypothetical protein
MPQLLYKQYDANNNIINEGGFSAGQSLYENNYWFKAEKEVVMSANTKKIDLYIKGGKKEYIALDEVMIRPVNSIYFYKTNDTALMINNRPVKTKR